MKRSIRKTIKITSVLLISLSIILVVLVFITRNILQKNNITFDSFQYRFPHQLFISGLKAFPDSSFYLELDHLDIEWSWTSLIKFNPKVYELNVRNGNINILGSESSDTSDFNIPVFSLFNTNFENIKLDYFSSTDSIRLNLSSLYISRVIHENEFQVDTLAVTGTDFSYVFLQIENQPDENSDFDFAAIPGFQVKKLLLEECGVILDDQENSQSISDINLGFTGLKSTYLFDVEIERLGFTYQDTLDLDIVLEDGKLNQDLQADLRNISIGIPGARLNIAEIYADASDELQLSLSLNDSYIAFGRLFQLYPEITAALDPGIPPDSLIHIKGDISFYGDSLFLESVNLNIFDSTSITATGYVDWSGEFADINLDLYPLKTSNTNLYALLTEESYNEFFTWPNDIRGKAKLTSTPVSIDIAGNLQTREGNLSAKSIISIDMDSDFVFSLALQGDSLLLDQFVSIIPDSIPYGDVDFFISYSGEEAKGNEELLIDIYSDQLFAYGKLLSDIKFRYYFDYLGDSIKARVNDDSLKLNLAMFVPPGEDSDYYFEGEINDVYPNSFIEALPEAMFSTMFSGSFNIGEDDLWLDLELVETRLMAETESLDFPDSEFSLKDKEGVMTLLLQSDGRQIIKGRSGSDFPEFQMPLNEWLSNWPETKLDASIFIDDNAFYILTGNEGFIDIESLTITKTGTDWNADVFFPALSYSGTDVQNLVFDINSNSELFDVNVAADTLGSSSVQFADFDLNLGYSSGQYSLLMKNIYSETKGINKIALILDELDEGYNLRFNEEETLTIDNYEFEITKNHGFDFNDSLKLVYGDLALQIGPSRIEVLTLRDNVNLAIDSLNISSIIEYFTETNFIQADLNAVANFNLKTSEAEWSGNVLALVFDDQISTEIQFDGTSKEDEFYSGFTMSHDDFNADISISQKSDNFYYSGILDKFDLKFLELIPDVSPDLQLKGTITGEVEGEIGENVTADGYFIAEEIGLNMPLVYTPLSIAKDTLFLRENELILNNFVIQDEEKNDLVLNGIVEYYPVPEFDFEIKSDKFRLLNNNDTKALVNGRIEASTDIVVKGGIESIQLSGFIKTLPGANVRYLMRESFDLVDASQIVTFTDFSSDSAELKTTAREGNTEINWNVDLEIAETSIEVLLDEVSQEFVNLTGKGNLKLRTGESMVPLVYGSFNSTTGTAFIVAPAIPDLDLVIEKADISWKGFLDEPLISFEGYKVVKASPRGLGAEFTESTNVEEFKVKVILENASLSQLDLGFDLEGETTGVKNYLQSIPLDTRQSYAINLLVFGRIGTEEVSGNSVAVEQVTNKLNEIARRNLKNSDISFNANSYTEGSLEGTEQVRTDLNYSIRKGFLDNRLSFSVGGSVGIYMDNMSEPPPSNLLGNIQVDYKLRETPSILLRGSRQDVYHGIIDGDITETSLGLHYQRTWPRFDDFLKLGKKVNNEESDVKEE